MELEAHGKCIGSEHIAIPIKWSNEGDNLVGWIICREIIFYKLQPFF